MKKSLALSVLAFALAVLPAAHAATLGLSPQTVTVAPGDTVTVTVSVDPAGATLSAVKSVISYSAGFLTPSSFAYGPTWVPVTQSGYDQMSGGTIIKSAGYPGGLTAVDDLGTITFTASAAGVATVAVDSASSVAYNASNQNVLSGSQGVATITVAVAPAPATAATTTTPTTAPTTASTPPSTHSNSGTSAGAPASAPAPTVTAPSTTGASSTASTTGIPPQTAAVAGAGATFLNSVWTWVILALLILIAGGSWLYARHKQQQ